MPDPSAEESRGAEGESDAAEQDGVETPPFECPWCGSPDYAYGGRIQAPPSHMETTGQGEVSCEPVQVMVCRKCRCRYIRYGGRIRDVTKLVELHAWADLQKMLREISAGSDD